VVQPRRARFVTLAPNGDVAPGIRAVATHGHTAGHVSFHLESEGQRLLVSGDVANHHVLALNNPDWPFGFDADPAQAAATRRDLNVGARAAGQYVVRVRHSAGVSVHRVVVR
jgi:glyoxylase-like metal-dependent hydrolase (beta-lactamase superfamily II)